MIFQFFLPQFRAVAVALRAAGVRSHFTIGGHYASLCPDELLAQLPELDSVTRSRGAHPAGTGGGPRRRQTLVHGRGTGLRRGRGDGRGDSREPAPRLNPGSGHSPLPARPYDPELIVGFRTLPLLASRGCARRCSFCSIHTFYRTAPGKTVRIRSAARVVEEMRMLYDEHGVRVFLFQDDDFPLWGRAGAKWVDELAHRLRAADLAERVLWKISCARSTSSRNSSLRWLPPADRRGRYGGRPVPPDAPVRRDADPRANWPERAC